MFKNILYVITHTLLIVSLCSGSLNAFLMRKKPVETTAATAQPSDPRDQAIAQAKARILELKLIPAEALTNYEATTLIPAAEAAKAAFIEAQTTDIMTKGGSDEAVGAALDALTDSKESKEAYKNALITAWANMDHPDASITAIFARNPEWRTLPYPAVEESASHGAGEGTGDAVKPFTDEERAAYYKACAQMDLLSPTQQRSIQDKTVGIANSYDWALRTLEEIRKLQTSAPAPSVETHKREAFIRSMQSVFTSLPTPVQEAITAQRIEDRDQRALAIEKARQETNDFMNAMEAAVYSLPPATRQSFFGKGFDRYEIALRIQEELAKISSTTTPTGSSPQPRPASPRSVPGSSPAPLAGAGEPRGAISKTPAEEANPIRKLKALIREKMFFGDHLSERQSREFVVVNVGKKTVFFNSSTRRQAILTLAAIRNFLNEYRASETVERSAEDNRLIPLFEHLIEVDILTGINRNGFPTWYPLYEDGNPYMSEAAECISGEGKEVFTDPALAQECIDFINSLYPSEAPAAAPAALAVEASAPVEDFTGRIPLPDDHPAAPCYYPVGYVPKAPEAQVLVPTTTETDDEDEDEREATEATKRLNKALEGVELESPRTSPQPSRFSKKFPAPRAYTPPAVQAPAPAEAPNPFDFENDDEYAAAIAQWKAPQKGS